MPETGGLYSVLLYVNSLAESVEFYGEILGLPQLGPEDDGVVRFDGGETVIVLHETNGDPDWPVPGIEKRPGGHSISLEADDPDAWVDRLDDHGVGVERGPLDQVWGRVMFVLDPDDRVISLVDPSY